MGDRTVNLCVSVQRTLHSNRNELTIAHTVHNPGEPHREKFIAHASIQRFAEVQSPATLTCSVRGKEEHYPWGGGEGVSGDQVGSTSLCGYTRSMNL